MTSRIFQKDLKLMKKTDLEHISHELGIPYSKNISKKRLITLLLEPLTSEYSYQMWFSNFLQSDKKPKKKKKNTTESIKKVIKELDDRIKKDEKEIKDLENRIKQNIKKKKDEKEIKLLRRTLSLRKDLENRIKQNLKKKNYFNIILSELMVKDANKLVKKYEEIDRQAGEKEDFSDVPETKDDDDNDDDNRERRQNAAIKLQSFVRSLNSKAKLTKLKKKKKEFNLFYGSLQKSKERRLKKEEIQLRKKYKQVIIKFSKKMNILAVEYPSFKKEIKILIVLILNIVFGNRYSYIKKNKQNYKLELQKITNDKLVRKIRNLFYIELINRLAGPDSPPLKDDLRKNIKDKGIFITQSTNAIEGSIQVYDAFKEMGRVMPFEFSLIYLNETKEKRNELQPKIEKENKKTINLNWKEESVIWEQFFQTHVRPDIERLKNKGTQMKYGYDIAVQRFNRMIESTGDWKELNKVICNYIKKSLIDTFFKQFTCDYSASPIMPMSEAYQIIKNFLEDYKSKELKDQKKFRQDFKEYVLRVLKINFPRQGSPFRYITSSMIIKILNSYLKNGFKKDLILNKFKKSNINENYLPSREEIIAKKKQKIKDLRSFISGLREKKRKDLKKDLEKDLKQKYNKLYKDINISELKRNLNKRERKLKKKKEKNAINIQKLVRGHLSRSKKKRELKNAINIQKLVRGHSSRSKTKQIKLKKSLGSSDKTKYITTLSTQFFDKFLSYKKSFTQKKLNSVYTVLAISPLCVLGTYNSGEICKKKGLQSYNNPYKYKKNQIKNQIKKFLTNTSLKGKIIKEDIQDIVDSVNKVFSKGNLSDIERYLLRDKRREKNRLEKTQKKLLDDIRNEKSIKENEKKGTKEEDLEETKEEDLEETKENEKKGTKEEKELRVYNEIDDRLKVFLSIRFYKQLYLSNGMEKDKNMKDLWDKLVKLLVSGANDPEKTYYTGIYDSMWKRETPDRENRSIYNIYKDIHTIEGVNKEDIIRGDENIEIDEQSKINKRILSSILKRKGQTLTPSNIKREKKDKNRSLSPRIVNSRMCLLTFLALYEIVLKDYDWRNPIGLKLYTDNIDYDSAYDSAYDFINKRFPLLLRIKNKEYYDKKIITMFNPKTVIMSKQQFRGILEKYKNNNKSEKTIKKCVERYYQTTEKGKETIEKIRKYYKMKLSEAIQYQSGEMIKRAKKKPSAVMLEIFNNLLKNVYKSQEIRGKVRKKQPVSPTVKKPEQIGLLKYFKGEKLAGKEVKDLTSNKKRLISSQKGKNKTWTTVTSTGSLVSPNKNVWKIFRKPTEKDDEDNYEEQRNLIISKTKDLIKINKYRIERLNLFRKQIDRYRKEIKKNRNQIKNETDIDTRSRLERQLERREETLKEESKRLSRNYKSDMATRYKSWCMSVKSRGLGQYFKNQLCELSPESDKIANKKIKRKRRRSEKEKRKRLSPINRAERSDKFIYKLNDIFENLNGSISRSGKQNEIRKLIENYTIKFRDLIDLAQNVYELKEIRTYFENIENKVREFYNDCKNLYNNIKKLKKEIEEPTQKEENKSGNEKKLEVEMKKLNEELKKRFKEKPIVFDTIENAYREDILFYVLKFFKDIKKYINNSISDERRDEKQGGRKRKSIMRKKRIIKKYKNIYKKKLKKIKKSPMSKRNKRIKSKKLRSQVNKRISYLLSRSHPD